MSQPGPKSSSPFTPDYRAPEAKKTGMGCLVLSLFLAVAVASLCLQAIPYMLRDRHVDYVIIMLCCPVILAVLAGTIHTAHQKIAVPIAVISVITFLLMMGLCADVNIVIRPGRVPPATAPATLPGTMP